MKPQRPYLLRALYDWIVDSGEVPHLVIDATLEDVQVPQEHVRDGQIVLNIGPNAVRNLSLGDEFVMFDGRFSGVSMNIVLPMAAIKAIYARESAQGMVFPEEDYEASPRVVGAEPGSDASETEERDDGGRGPDLRLV